MNSVLIKKAILIAAPKERVWKVLLNETYTRIWYAEFSLGARADTNWEEGSKVFFTDLSGSGLVGQILTNDPYRKIVVEYQGLVISGEEDYESPEARLVRGGHETYLLTEQRGSTELSIETDMPDELVESMSQAWNRALQKVQELAESL
jgi:uncharacterized protein YndB with AHSA1/START domain